MKHIYQQAKFYITVNDLRALPKEPLKEIAIAGRSNAGKSSLLNTLTKQTKLAFTSKTPGRTQHINYFTINEEEQLFLVDLPGYGYAKVPEPVRRHWVELLGNYLQSRQQLVALLLIMDCRHPLKDLDIKMIEFFAVTGKPLHIVLSKIDKLTNQQRLETLRLVTHILKQYKTLNFSISLFSSLKKLGIQELEEALNKLFE